MIKGEWVEKTIELTELIPYMDDRLLTDEVLKELGFDRTDIPEEETGGDPLHYWSYEFHIEKLPNNMCLITHDVDKNGHYTVSFFDYKTPLWKTAGGIKTLLMAMNGE